MRLRARVIGRTAVQTAITKEIERREGALHAALYQEGFRIDADAVKRTPVDTGRLRATHYVAPPKLRRGQATVEVGFGTNYAEAVHERVEVFHVNGQPLFLKIAADRARKGWTRRLKQRAGQNYKRGIGPGGVVALAPVKPKDQGEEWQRGKSKKKSDAERRGRS